MSVAEKGKEAVHTIAQVGEGAVVSAALGAIFAKKGSLDIQVTAKVPPVPVDLAVGAVGIVAAMFLSDSEGTSRDLRNIGSAATNIFVFRTVNKMMGGTKMHGETEIGAEPVIGAEDPIVAAARLLT
jgi:hypothetical protein